MSRTKRALPHDIVRDTKTLEETLAEWGTVYRGQHYALQQYRFNASLGRDGGYHSGVYVPRKRAPNFLDRWREDAIEQSPKKKRFYKKELAQLRRRDAKDKIGRALRLGDEV